VANSKTRNEQRKTNDTTPPGRREAKSKGKGDFNKQQAKG